MGDRVFEFGSGDIEAIGHRLHGATQPAFNTRVCRTAAAQRSTPGDLGFSTSDPNTLAIQLCCANTPSVTPRSGAASTGLFDAMAIPASTCIHGDVHTALNVSISAVPPRHGP